MLLNTLSFIVKSRNLNIKSLASYCDIGYESMIKLVNNPEKLPNATNLRSLCEALQTTPQSIFFYTGINEEDFYSKNKSEQKFLIDCSRYFVVLFANYHTKPENLLINFDRDIYKELTDDNGRKYYTLENLFDVIENFKSLYYLSLNISDELASPHIADYDSKISAWQSEYEELTAC